MVNVKAQLQACAERLMSLIDGFSQARFLVMGDLSNNCIGDENCFTSAARGVILIWFD
ncbi:hypothetical protein [Gloeocapsopsis dulcis]|uniref:hypothetical protein n=1 Tax=Gloeocapsopsis dulcis TaxID=2859516 RepID=UPI0012DA3F1C|nr:hypothetical protein [Gloeocapsopsis dulcis]WNN90635.1 hypothetical protein P0S91_06000 [Gloeocapsopsis dulcis]